MKLSAKTAALALGIATLGAATVPPAAAEDFAIRPGCGGTLVGRSGCGSTNGSPNSASVGSAASTASGAGGGLDVSTVNGVTSVSNDNNKVSFYPDGTKVNANYDPDNNVTTVTITNPQTGVTTTYERSYLPGGGWVTTSTSTKGSSNAGSGGKGHSTFSRPLPNKSESAPTAPVSANVFGGAVNASSLAVSNETLGDPVAQATAAPKKPVTARIISASPQGRATALQPVVHPQPIGPVGSSSMNARQKALGAGSR